MKRLAPEAFDRAGLFLKTQARPLDRALFEYRFENAPVDRVTTELARFRNEDGGFGHALEPDVRTPSSSALATEIGLTILEELGCGVDHPLVRGAVRYLLETLDEQQQVWRVIPTDANDHPHAPWWHDEEGSLARTFDDFIVIPRARIIGQLYHHAGLVPDDWLAELAERTVADIEAFAGLGSGGGDTLAYGMELAQAEGLPSPLRERLLRRIRAVVPEAVERDPAKWNTYCIAPLKIVSSPQSPVADLIWEDLQAHLDYQVDHQTEAGTWEPTWSWRGMYPEVWEQAKLEWRGQLTLRTLTTLKNFGRI